MFRPSVTVAEGSFGGGDHPTIPVTVRIVDLSIPDGHILVGGRLYRMTHDPEELQRIVYPDGSRPTACAYVSVED